MMSGLFNKIYVAATSFTIIDGIKTPPIHKVIATCNYIVATRFK